MNMRKLRRGVLMFTGWLYQASADKKLTLSEGAELLQGIADLMGWKLVHDMAPKQRTPRAPASAKKKVAKKKVAISGPERQVNR